MSFPDIVFYALAAILLLSALRVVTARNPVHAALFLVLSFAAASGLWLLLHAEFLAITLILVYVGAVMVLFLFVIMMLDINVDRMREGFWRMLPIALPVALVLLAIMAVTLAGPWFGLAVRMPVPEDATRSNTRELGQVLYTEYVYPFELAAVILLVAIIAAIALTLRARKNVRHTDPAEQVRARREDRVRLVDLREPRREAGGEPPPPSA